ncbi:MAG: chitobiase/beta-hexosaminidase C-terminal domain-containing protein, partial [Nitrospirota bacterium]
TTAPTGTVATTNVSVNPPTAINVSNAPSDFGYEYVWHCHILGHEENDFMRPMIFRVPTGNPAAPSSLTIARGGPGTGYGTNQNVLTWADNANNLATFEVQRSPQGAGSWTTLAYMQSLPTFTPTYVDSAVDSAVHYDYQVRAFNYWLPNLGNDIRTLGTSPYDMISNTTTSTFSPATGVTLTPNKPTPHPMGTNVLFTAVATGPSTSMVYKYRFSLNNVVQQNYSTMPAWALPASTPTGAYTVNVDVQSGASTTPDVSSSMTYTVITPSAPIVAVDPYTLPGIYTGPSVTVLMYISSSTPATIYYTTDGSQPTTSSSQYLSSGITVTATKTINYYPVDVNGTAGAVVSSIWSIHSPDMAASMLINNGAISINTTTANLTLSAVDPAVCPNFPTGVQSMQFSNDGITYSAEEPYATSKIWNLAPGPDGPRTVYVKFRDCSLPLTPAPGGTLYSPISATINLIALPSGNLGYGSTVGDALRALLIAAGIVAPTATDMMNGDVAPLIGGIPHPDGKIDMGDVIVLLRRAVGLVTW